MKNIFSWLFRFIKPKPRNLCPWCGKADLVHTTIWLKDEAGELGSWLVWGCPNCGRYE